MNGLHGKDALTDKGLVQAELLRKELQQQGFSLDKGSTVPLRVVDKVLEDLGTSKHYLGRCLMAPDLLVAAAGDQDLNAIFEVGDEKRPSVYRFKSREVLKVEENPLQEVVVRAMGRVTRHRFKLDE